MRRNHTPYALASIVALVGVVVAVVGTAGATPFAPQYVTLPACPAPTACVAMSTGHVLTVRGPDGVEHSVTRVYPLPHDRFEVNATELPAALTAGLTRHKRTGYTGDY